ncbi:hypothetical protein FN846DRAFT_894194 [Sphaerosporella brunnea]|uniref:Bromo domain-containing protein n=1 Tax=Sphaerosporella brunnea TaxID=1250544 RepID=A0A5J5EI44_9PEZI|nr:hypothetical protein FN846DRAFT_894194 [Sphaerosporella brunnea]
MIIQLADKLHDRNARTAMEELCDFGLSYIHTNHKITGIESGAGAGAGAGAGGGGGGTREAARNGDRAFPQPVADTIGWPEEHIVASSRDPGEAQPTPAVPARVEQKGPPTEAHRRLAPGTAQGARTASLSAVPSPEEPSPEPAQATPPPPDPAPKPSPEALPAAPESPISTPAARPTSPVTAPSPVKAPSAVKAPVPSPVVSPVVQQLPVPQPLPAPPKPPGSPIRSNREVGQEKEIFRMFANAVMYNKSSTEIVKETVDMAKDVQGMADNFRAAEQAVEERAREESERVAGSVAATDGGEEEKKGRRRKKVPATPSQEKGDGEE